MGFRLLCGGGHGWNAEHSIQSHLMERHQVSYCFSLCLFSHLWNGSDSGNVQGCVRVSSKVHSSLVPCRCSGMQKGLWLGTLSLLYFCIGSCGVSSSMDSSCLAWRLSWPCSPCPPLHGAGVESSRNAQCVLPSILRPPAPSGWGHEAHGPVSYVPTHTHSHNYAPFSEGESDPRLAPQAGEGSPDEWVRLWGFPIFFLSSACSLGHPWPV